MSAPAFQAWPKTARHFRDIIVTEKLDGTNSAIHITDEGEIHAQSRNRLITPEDDNYGFARWAHANREALVELLGPGTHFGEWWGKGIQRGYNVPDKRFWLFNTSLAGKIEWRHTRGDQAITDLAIGTVPVLYEGPNESAAIRAALERLRDEGSVASPGFTHPEGVCIFHSTSRLVTKVTLDKNDAGKWEEAAA